MENVISIPYSSCLGLGHLVICFKPLTYPQDLSRPDLQNPLLAEQGDVLSSIAPLDLKLASPLCSVSLSDGAFTLSISANI